MTNINKLLEKITADMFKEIDFDEILDNRDTAEFDEEWIRVYSEIENLKNDNNYNIEIEEASDKIRENAFTKVYDLCENSELAEYISDDFGLIFDSEHLGYKDKWLDKVISCYMQSIIPCLLYLNKI